MIPTTADFYDETGHRARWLGALHGNADPETLRDLDSGRLLLEATDPTTFADAVLDLLDVFTQQDLGHSHHPRDGWPWSWPDSRKHRLDLPLRPRSRVGDHRAYLELCDAAS